MRRRLPRPKVGQIEDGSRLATYRAQSAPRGSEVIRLRKQVSELQQKFRPPHPVQGSEDVCENLRKRAAKRHVPTVLSHTNKIWKCGFPTRIWNSGTHWSLGTRPFQVEVALRRDVIDAKNSRTVLSNHRFQCCKHGHYVRRDSRHGYRIAGGRNVPPWTTNESKIQSGFHI